MQHRTITTNRGQASGIFVVERPNTHGMRCYPDPEAEPVQPAGLTGATYPRTGERRGVGGSPRRSPAARSIAVILYEQPRTSTYRWSAGETKT